MKTKMNFKSPYFIAEIGVNHNGNINLAKKMILAAKLSMADAVKFQTYYTENLALPTTPKVKYQKKKTPKNQSHFQMLKSLELSKEMHYELFKFCKKAKIDFISTPYGIKEAKFLNKLGCKIFKTSSADLVDHQMHEYLAKNSKTVFISVGMSSISEIQDCVSIYKKFGNKKFVLLHCVSNYPCSYKSLNIKVLKTLKKIFNCQVGFSDHSIGYEASMLSLAYGAKVIEKHFTIDKKLKGPDQEASILPEDFLKLVNMVKKAKIILGNDKKKCQPEEKEMSLVSRKSLTLNKNLKKNTVMKKEFLTLKRPGLGIFYKDLKNILGRKIKKDLKINYQPKFKDFY